MYDSVAFRTFEMLCGHHFHLVPKTFSSPQKAMVPLVTCQLWSQLDLPAVCDFGQVL